MKQTYSHSHFHFLGTALLTVSLCSSACDGPTVADSTDFPTASTVAAYSNDAQAYAAYLEMSGDEIVASLEDAASKRGYFGGVVSVMTRNMYVGTDVDAVIAAQPQDVPAAVAQAWATLQQTDFEGRMKAMAREIAFARPHLVGLQEVTTFHTQTPGDMVFGGTTPASDVQMDFLATLLDELEALGQSYRAVAAIQNVDVEMPLIHDPATFYSTDIRMTDYDVILARDDVETSNIVAQNYAASFPVFGGSVIIQRGFVALDARIRGTTYRFVSTHLEPVETYGGYFQGEQATELLGILDSETKPLILVGDLNTEATSGAVYNALVSSGFTDVWTLQPSDVGPGFTCCQDPDLSNEVSKLDRRIDLVLIKNFERGHSGRSNTSAISRVTGTRSLEKTVSGLWSSDHAGVASWLFSGRR